MSTSKLKRLFTLLPLICAGTVGPPAARAQDATDLIQSSLLRGSERLVLYSLSEYREGSQGEFLLNVVEPRLRRLAFTLLAEDRYPRGIIAHRSSASPILTWHDNINGGNRNSTFELGGVQFRFDERSIALSGILVGASFETETRIAYARGQYLRVNGRASAAYSPEHEIGRYSIDGSVCSENFIRGWMFLDICGSGYRLIEDLDTSNSYALSASVTNLLSFAGGHHEVSFGIRREFFEDYDQTAASVDWMGSYGSMGLWDASISVGMDVPGQLALSNAFSLGYTNIILDRPTRFVVSRTIYDGGRFFGAYREDERYAIGIDTRVNEDIRVGASAVSNRSTVDFYTYDSIVLSLNITGFRF